MRNGRPHPPLPPPPASTHVRPHICLSRFRPFLSASPNHAAIHTETDASILLHPFASFRALSLSSSQASISFRPPLALCLLLFSCLLAPSRTSRRPTTRVAPVQRRPPSRMDVSAISIDATCTKISPFHPRRLIFNPESRNFFRFSSCFICSRFQSSPTEGGKM